jgi:hypothetical protein
MRLRDVTFQHRVQTHGQKQPKEKWLRELYPWPVLAQIDCDVKLINQPQRIFYDGAEFEATLKSIRFQSDHGTYRYRVFVESNGLGWHCRSYADEFDICGTPAGQFVTLFNRKKEESLERIGRLFFNRNWTNLAPSVFKTLAVSRFLTACLTAEVVEEAFSKFSLSHYPQAQLTAGSAPMFADGDKLWIGYRFFSEHAYDWARRSARKAQNVLALYFVDTKHQFKTDLPSGSRVQCVTELDGEELGGRHQDLIRVLIRNMELPTREPPVEQLEPIVLGQISVTAPPLSEADVHEALVALKRTCDSKSELRYQLAAAVLLNTWIESERKLGFKNRKKFYAFKKRVDTLATWASAAQLSGVKCWTEALPNVADPILYIRIDNVDFSFHEIPFARRLLTTNKPLLKWSGVRLKPIAPLVLAWARGLLATVAESGSKPNPLGSTQRVNPT